MDTAKAEINQHGFDFEHQKVTILWSHKGASAIRVLNKVNGKYVDVQTSPKGKKSHVSCGVLSKDVLARWT